MLALLGQMPQDCLVQVGTVSCRIGVGEANEVVTVPSFDGLNPSLLDREAQTCMVETHQGADARKVEALQNKSSVGSLGSHGHGLGCLVQVVDRNILPGLVGSVDALARRIMDIEGAGIGILVRQLSNFQKITFDVQIIAFGCRGNPGVLIQWRRQESWGWRWRGCRQMRQTSEQELPKLRAIQFMPTFKDGVAFGMEDSHCCLVENNSATLVGKRPQTYEGMGERGHNMA